MDSLIQIMTRPLPIYTRGQKSTHTKFTEDALIIYDLNPKTYTAYSVIPYPLPSLLTYHTLCLSFLIDVVPYFRKGGFPVSTTYTIYRLQLPSFFPQYSQDNLTIKQNTDIHNSHSL
jgi:hypothetical protein